MMPWHGIAFHASGYCEWNDPGFPSQVAIWVLAMDWLKWVPICQHQAQSSQLQRAQNSVNFASKYSYFHSRKCI